MIKPKKIENIKYFDDITEESRLPPQDLDGECAHWEGEQIANEIFSESSFNDNYYGYADDLSDF